MASDAEDEDLRRAIAMSLIQPESNAINPMEGLSAKNTSATDDTTAQNVALTGSSSLVGLDRKAMEQERLARLASRAPKRERSISPPPRRSRKAPKTDSSTSTLPSGARLTSFSSLVAEDQKTRKDAVAQAATQALSNGNADAKMKTSSSTIPPTQSSSLQYPQGVVKKTWCFGHDRKGNDIKLEEVLEPLTLHTAVLSAFQWDTDWILGKLRIPPKGGSTKCIFVMQGKEESLRRQMLSETEHMRGFLRLCFPPMQGQVHCMHSKLMLLFHDSKLRIAVPSANLVPYDWGEHGTMENSVFVIDLPRLPDGTITSLEHLTFFGKELLFFLEQQGLDDDVRNGILNFDFTATKSYAFVHTVGGTLFGKGAERTGLAGLAQSVRDLGLSTNKGLQIDFAASSIGSLNDGFLATVHAAARGEDRIHRQTAATSKKTAEFFSAKSPASKDTYDVRDHFRIYFPTHKTVAISLAGAAGTICLQRKWFEGKDFPRDIFRDYRSVRPGVLSHNKILYARGRATAGGRRIAWAYVGSANMSESAWGKFTYGKAKRESKTAARNWECGVLVPVPVEKLARLAGKHSISPPTNEPLAEREDAETESEDEVHDDQVVSMGAFEGTVDVPFQYPGLEYRDREPWYFTE